MSNLTIYKDNYLIEASYKLTLIEQRLMLYCISKLNPEKPEQQQSIIVEDFVNQFDDLDKNSAYKQIKRAVETLYERSISVKDPKMTKKFRWIQSAEYRNDCGTAVIEFSNAIMPYLCQLERQFTKYKLRNISAFKRTYSIRLYELLTQYRTLKSRVLSVLDLRVALMLDDKFCEWRDLKRNVLDFSLQEINEKSDLLIEYELIKRGRSVDSIKFSIQEKSKINNKKIKQIANNKERSNTSSIPQNVQNILDEIKNNLKK